ncbi:phage tail collar domain protein [Kordia sp. SMS9]|uniref:phage tail protein n=1 Tax=Kordia sp. SMS9 TaxID=2282170 RepID=UPI000E0DC22C|nr:tail fiber protein [Kordia sp. SMS9]AXG71543.1 phage tail collar domain protein [Kordia sp. SMS9]
MDPFIGEIVMFGGNFAPRGWALCNGQLLAISSNSALFSILGTTYGGDGRTSFALPDLRGRAAVHPGTGPGLSTIKLGQRGGAEYHTLTVNQMPMHNHLGSMRVSNVAGDDDVPGTNASIGASEIYVEGAPNTSLANGSVTTLNNGGGQQFYMRNPFEGINYIIAMLGVYPSRS